MSNKMALDALKFAEAALADIGDADREPGDDLAWCEARAAEALPQTRAAIAALEAEPQDGDVEQALNRMDALLDPSLNLLAVSENSITLQGCRADMLTIRRALRMAPAAREGWQPIETAPKDGLFQDGNNHYAEYILAWHPAASLPYRARWWFRDDTGACNFLADGGYAVFPTVFQPLPTPPKD